MSINPYFKLYKTGDAANEQTLIRNFFSEAISIYGQDVHYIIRNIENEDYLFKEDVLSSFSETYEIEMYLENFDSFEGDDIISKFGFQIQDRMLFSVSVDRFLEETGMPAPNEGDLIYLPLANVIFEIKFVEDEQQFYPIGTLPAYKLSCELFRFDNQDFTTDIPEIDGINAFDITDPEGISPFADNDEIQTEGDKIIIKEDNPFGNY